MTLLISQSEIEDLPEDPRQRFVAIEEICRKRHYDQIAHEEDWPIVQDSRLRYMGTIVAAAKYLKIAPICDIEVPRKSRWNDEEFQDFVSELQFYTVQLMLEGAERNSRASIVLQGNTRDRLLTLTSHLREQVRKLDLPPARIDQLVRRVDAFEDELQNPKLPMVAVAAMVLAVVAAISDLGGTASVVRQLINQVEEAVGLAKDEQDKEAASRMLPQEEVRQLAPPRATEAPLLNPSDGRLRDEIDDEIPF